MHRLVDDGLGLLGALFDGLHRVGISTTGAWMVGFDFQTRENIEEDLQDFIDLAPSLQQLTRVCPFPPTPLWRMLKDEGRIREDVKWEDISFYGGGGMVLSKTITAGLLSGVDREIDGVKYYQISAAINPGNSGGPLFNAQGQLIGINGRCSFEKRGRVNVGVGYAISINQIKKFLGYLRSFDKRSYNIFRCAK